MALKKAKQMTNGTTAEYWRIIQLNINWDRLDAVIDLAVYLTKAAREAGATPMYSFQHALGAEFTELLFNGNDKVKNVNLNKAYSEFKAQAVVEAAKPDSEEKNTALAWFADATDA
jgi:hypothetical protein